MSAALPVVQEGGAVAVTPISNAGSLLTAIARVASDPSANMDNMERLFAMHQTLVKAEAETQFNAALARAQAQIPTVVHNAANTQTSSKYAKLAAINKAITPIYTAEGFSVSFDTADSPREGYMRTVAMLSHSGGHTRSYHIDMPPDEAGAQGKVNKTRVHATGSTSSYARRYLVCMIFNVTTKDDNDGNSKPSKGMPDGQRADFEAAIDAVTDLPAWTELWARILKVSTDCGDVAAHEELRSLMAAKRKGLK